MSWIPFSLGGLIGLVFYQQLWIHRIKKSYKSRDELFQCLTENAADMIAMVDVKGHRLYNSPSYKRILGYSGAELGETSAFEQIHPDDRFKVLEASREARETGHGRRMEYRIRHKDGSWKILESIAGAVRDDKGQVSKLVIVNRDITDRKRAEQLLEHNMFHDPLTGLPNRRAFFDRLQRVFLSARRNPAHHFALLLVNIDHFKVFNDRLGTAAGDQVLQEIARRIGACLRQEDSIARHAGGSSADPALSRLGGDEFTILLDWVGDPSDAMRVARRVQSVVAEPLLADGKEVRASICLGIALSTEVHQRPEDLLTDADVALRRCKALGGSRCELFDEAMHARAAGRLRLEEDLHTALEHRQFRVFYQPVVHLESRRIVSLEALLRWDHPTQGLVSPHHFLEAAEDTGLMVTIGQWLILQACRQMREWDANNFFQQPVNVTVNLSARQFADARLVNDIQDALRETGVNPSRLQLEMTESVAAVDPKLTVTVLSHLKHMGIGVILDDFGTGLSSLSGLRQFPVDALKIDRALIREMQSDRTAADMIEVIITLAHKMNLQVIAEGIENTKQVERLRELTCELGQGYFFSQPLDSKAVVQLVRQQAPPARSAAAP
jgi:diguanylate cyclase (GGDEF)-like protein/PAS domain S-box-containing protein